MAKIALVLLFLAASHVDAFLGTALRRGNFGGPLPEGGTITEQGGYRIHTFTANGTFINPSTRTIQALIVAGGGGGGNAPGGNGAVNTGGGGAGHSLGAAGGAGGSGIVIVAYGYPW